MMNAAEWVAEKLGGEPEDHESDAPKPDLDDLEMKKL